MQKRMNPRSILEKCKIINLTEISDYRGSLTFIEGKNDIPFDIKRVFYLYDVPANESRGGHAHKELHQFVVCLSGSFDVHLNDGIETKIIHLSKPKEGLYIHPMIWASEIEFSPGAVCLVLASDYYDEEDYYRDYVEYLNTRGISG